MDEIPDRERFHVNGGYFIELKLTGKLVCFEVSQLNPRVSNLLDIMAGFNPDWRFMRRNTGGYLDREVN
ncbi:MAG: hypothetical protein SFX18_02395 [Pirellulales bacterium]|nr:hypothetical protein [Pirellulales bacterium]